MKILAIHAHPDDIEILCAGTLALLRQQGHDIFMATMTAGDKGSPDKPQEEIANIRRHEAAQSAKLLNAGYQCLEFKDMAIFDTDEGRRTVTQHLREVQPDIIFTSSPIDYLADHEQTSHIVRSAAFAAGIPNYKTGSDQLLKKIPYLYYMDPIEGTDHFGQEIVPDFFVDISETIEIKTNMLACHASQREWLKAHHGIDHYVIAMKEWAQIRGEQVNTDYAEGFRQHKGHSFPKDNILKTLLESKIISK